MRRVDRISTLPDGIICDRILSLLSTKDSVRTSALSTRWKHLYASVPVFDFECNGDFEYNGDSGLVSKILNTLTSNQPRMSRIRIDCLYLSNSLDFVKKFNRLRPCVISDIITWINIATSRSVQLLAIHGCCLEAGATPHSLFTCETLATLRLNVNIVLSVPDVVHLPKLRELIMNNFNLRDELSDDESVRRLFSSCPVLEKLMLFLGPMPNVRVFNVSVPSLRVLSLELRDSTTELIINCPKLEMLGCNCYTKRSNSGIVLESLEECHISISLSALQLQEGKLIELVRQVSKVQRLKLYGDTMELSSKTSKGWRMLASILNSSPRLETLLLRNGFLDRYGKFGNPFSPPEHAPVCLSSHLKVIRILNFLGNEDEYKWVEYFLTNALVLEKMEIRPWCLFADEVEGKSNSNSIRKISKRLLTLRPLSEVCQIILTSPDD